MADISNEFIKDSFDYVLQSDLSTGVVYRLGGEVPINPIFQSGLTINNVFTYSDGSEYNGFVLTSDANGNPTAILWADGNEAYDNIWDNRATTVSYS